MPRPTKRGILSQVLLRLAALVGATTLLVSTRAQNQATLTPIGQWPEYPMPLVRETPYMGMAVVGSHAYLAGPASGGLRLATLDVTTPSQPRYLSHLDAHIAIEDFLQGVLIRVRGNYAYILVSQGVSQLVVVDVSDPGEARLAGSCQLSGILPLGMDVVGTRIYVAFMESFVGGVLLINAADPAQPFVETSVASGGFIPFCVSVAGNYVYAAGVMGFWPNNSGHVDAIDVSDPSQPFAVGGFDWPDNLGNQVICAQGGLLHFAYELYDAVGYTSGCYEVLDLSDPVRPSPLGSYTVSTSWDSPLTIRVVGNIAYLVTTSGLRTIDFSDPRNLQRKAFVPREGSGIPGDYFDVVDQHAFWANGRQVEVLNVTDPAAPRQVAVFDTGFESLLFCVEGNLAYLLEADSKRFRVVDVSNPRAPTVVAHPQLSSAGPFKVVGQYAYVAAGSYLQVLDLSNPAQPVQAGRFNAPCNGVDVVGTRAYVTGTSPANRLTVIDIGNPAALVRLGSLALTNAPGPPQVVGDVAHFSLGYEGDLVSVDVRDPSQMGQVGCSKNALGGLQVVGRYGYGLVNNPTERSMCVLDLADPANPQRVGRFLWDLDDFGPEKLHVEGRYAFVSGYSNASNRVNILDVADPTQPVKVGEYRSERPISGFAMVVNTLYTTSDAGLTVLDFYAPNTSPNLRLNAPVLSGGVAVLTWGGGPGIKLQKTTSLSTPDWQDVPGTLGQSVFALPPTDTAAFFRLIQP
jgi:hypothetical protein